jgi:hypothetical protein
MNESHQPERFVLLKALGIATVISIGCITVLSNKDRLDKVDGDMIGRMIQRHTTTEKLATLRYHGEWSYGEYRECASVNVPEQDKQPELECAPAPTVEKIFKVGFNGELTYDDEGQKGAVLYWLCRRNESEPSFSCSAKANPVTPTTTSDDYLEKRKNCENRFINKKIYEVDGMDVIQACKQNPDRVP